MVEPLGSGQVKARFLADVLNKTLYTIITNCSKADGVRDYFQIGVVLAWRHRAVCARNGLQGLLGEEHLHMVSELAQHPLDVESRTRKVLGPNDEIIEQPVKFPIWFQPRSRGLTPMCAGLSMALKVLKAWCSKYPTAFPPTVLHITDGHPTDGDPEPIANKIKSLRTKDGECLLFNLHVDRGDRIAGDYSERRGDLQRRLRHKCFSGCPARYPRTRCGRRKVKATTSARRRGVAAGTPGS